MQTLGEVALLVAVSVIGGAVVINRFLKTSVEMENAARSLRSKLGDGFGHRNSRQRPSLMISNDDHASVSNVVVRLILNQTQILGLILKFELKWPEAVIMLFDGTDSVLRYVLEWTCELYIFEY